MVGAGHRGQNKANPLGAIGSVAAMLEYQFRSDERSGAVNAPWKRAEQRPCDGGLEAEGQAGNDRSEVGESGKLRHYESAHAVNGGSVKEHARTIIEKVWDNHVSPSSRARRP